MKKFPFLSLSLAVVLLRVTIAILFMAHALIRMLNGTIGRFGDFLEEKGFIAGTAIVWALTVFELAGGLLLALGYFTRLLSLGFILILVIGIVLIHAELGWFVGEHGTGGVEYSLALIMALLVVAASNEPGVFRSRSENNKTLE